MATSLRKLCEGSLRLINATQAGQAPEADDMDVTVQALNGMIDSWSAESLAIYSKNPYNFLLHGGKQDYTLGPGGDWDIERPMQIEQATVTLQGGSIGTTTTVQVPTTGMGPDYNGLCGLPDFQEQFTTGISAYTQSDPGLFTTFSDGVYGTTLGTTGGNTRSGNCLRTLGAPAQGNRFEIKFKVTSATTGSSPYAAFQNSSFSGPILSARTLQSIDFAQRIGVNPGSGMVYFNQTAVVGTWYLVRISYMPTVNGSFAQLFNAATNALIDTITFPGDRSAGVNFVNMNFVQAISTTNSGCQFDDIKVFSCSPTEPTTTIGPPYNLVRTQQSVDLPLGQMTDDQWASIAVKSTPSTFPNVFYDNGNYPLRTLSFWPIPTQDNWVTLWLWQPLTTTTDLDEDIEFPPGYERAMRFNLAVEIAAEFGKTIPDSVAMIAEQSFAKIKRLNSSPQYSQGSPELTAGSRPMNFNYITGNFLPLW